MQDWELAGRQPGGPQLIFRHGLHRRDKTQMVFVWGEGGMRCFTAREEGVHD